MAEQTDEKDATEIVRRDRYTIVVDGCAVRANEQQERAIRNMTARQRADFLHVMGRRTSPEVTP